MNLARKLALLAATSCSLLACGSTAFGISDCVYSGVNFSSGSISCQSGHQFRCSDGDWVSLDINCETPPSQPPPTVTSPGVCSCSDQESADCDRNNQNCCVALQDGSCIKRCCPR